MADNADMSLGLWKAYVEGVLKSPGAATNFIALGGTIDAVFDQKSAIALSQAYQLGGFIPEWTLLNPDSAVNAVSPVVSTNDLYDQYGLFLAALTPASSAVTPAQQAEIAQLQKTISSAKDDYVKVQTQAFAAWQKLAKIPSHPTWAQFITQEPWSGKLDTASNALLGPQSQLTSLMESVYGQNYKPIQLANDAWDAASPASQNSNAQYQMKVEADGEVISVPRYVLGEGGSLNAYATWLQDVRRQAVGGLAPAVEITFSQDDYTSDTSFNSFSAGGVLPLEDFCWVSASVSETHQTIDLSQSTFTGKITYQDTTTIEVAPDSQWFNGALLRDYRDVTDIEGHPFFGPGGDLAMVVSQIVIGYAPTITFDVSNWGSTDTQDTWSESVKFGFGPFTLASESDSGHAEEYQSTKTDTGLTMTDPSGQPKVIGLVVDTPNWPAAS
jgi:hypothetical protein